VDGPEQLAPRHGALLLIAEHGAGAGEHHRERGLRDGRRVVRDPPPACG
jgi:hypothetical protein